MKWKATYDPFGRRLQTVYTPHHGSPLKMSSYYDPEEMYQEIGVKYSKSIFFWKVCNGTICDLVVDDQGRAAGLIHDVQGNLKAVTTSKDVRFNDGYPAPRSLLEPPLKSEPSIYSYAYSLAWQSQQKDPTGFIWLKGRYYDPETGRFLNGQAANEKVY